jgi:hypothetical protein
MPGVGTSETLQRLPELITKHVSTDDGQQD